MTACPVAAPSLSVFRFSATPLSVLTRSDRYDANASMSLPQPWSVGIGPGIVVDGDQQGVDCSRH
jgi:hypothetical protein